PPRPAAVALVWSDPHVEAQEPPAGGHALSGHPFVPAGATKAHAVAHVCASWPHPVAMAMATAGVVTRSTSERARWRMPHHGPVRGRRGGRRGAAQSEDASRATT